MLYTCWQCGNSDEDGYCDYPVSWTNEREYYPRVQDDGSCRGFVNDKKRCCLCKHMQFPKNDCKGFCNKKNERHSPAGHACEQFESIEKEEPITPDGIKGFSCTNPINCLCRQKNIRYKYMFCSITNVVCDNDNKFPENCPLKKLDNNL